MITLNSAPGYDDELQLTSFAWPTPVFTFDIQVGLPADWTAAATAVPILQYGSQPSHSDADFSISTWSDYLDVYIGGTRFDTTIPISALIGTTHRVTITWDGTTARAYMDGVAKGSAHLTPAHTISTGGPLTLGAGNADNATPAFTFGDLKIYDVVNTNPASTTGLVGSWTAAGGTLASTIGGVAFTLDHHPVNEDLGPLVIGGTASHTIERAGDHDWYAVTLEEGKTYTFAMVGTGADHLRDPYLALYAADRTTVLASNDDAAPNHNSWFTFTAASSGTFYLDATGFDGTTGQYGISATLGTEASFDDAMGAGIIDSGYAWPGTRGTGLTITYGFEVTDPGERQNFVVFNPIMQAATTEILQLYSDITGLVFVNQGVTDDAQMRFSAYDESDGSGGHAHYPGDPATSSSDGDIHINYGLRDTIALGSYTWMVLLHEIGHALGLSHPGDYGTGGLGNLFLTDSIQYTNMSYSGPSRTGGDFGPVGGDADTPMLYDIMALQLMYGVNTATRAGDTIYGFHSNAGSRIYDFTQNTEPGLTIWDGGGSDTLDVSGFKQSQLIDLISGHFSDVGGLHHNISIAYGATIENAVGGSGDDTMIANDAGGRLSGGEGRDAITGGSGADTLIGGWGNDTLVGGEGDDVLMGRDGSAYSSNLAPTYGIDMNAGSTTNQYASVASYNGISGANSTVRFTIEMLFKITHLPSSEVDFWSYANGQTSNAIGLTAYNSGAVTVTYRGSEYTIAGVSAATLTDGKEHRFSLTWDGRTSASELVLYLDGIEIGRGTHPHQNWQMDAGGTLVFGQEQDSIGGGFQSSQIFPGTIGDIRVFNTVRTAGEIAANAFAPFASPASVPGLVSNWQASPSNASSMADAMGGAALTLVNGPALVTMGRWDNDSIEGGEGIDTVDYSAASTGVSVDLGRTDAQPISATEGSDTLSGIENIIGSNADGDILIGDGGSNRIEGRGGYNILDGAAGNDTLVGGSGANFMYGGYGDDTLEGGSGLNSMFGFVGNDTMLGGANGNTMNGEVGDDTLTGGAGVDYMIGGDGSDTLSGNGSGDALFGDDPSTPSLGGDDTLDGGDGDDGLDGGAGDDNLLGGAGVDWLYGGAGSDHLDGGDDTDALFGQDGNDLLHGGAGGDSLDGGADADQIFGDDGVDWLFGQAGNDALDGGAGGDVLFGGDGFDTLKGGADGDSLDGGLGDDTLDGGAGVDVLWGDAGADTFLFSQVTDGGDVVRDFISGTDFIGIDHTGFGLAFRGGLPANMLESGNGLPASFAASGPVFYFDTTGHGLWFDPTGGSSADVKIVAGFETGAPTAGDFKVV